MSGAGGHRVPMRWRDLDALGHVSHSAVLIYLEEGRDAFLKSRGIGPEQYVVGRCSITFRGEIDPSQEAVTVQCEVSDVGNSSLTTQERIVDSDGDALVEAEFGLVLWDGSTRGSRPLSDSERAALSAAGSGG